MAHLTFAQQIENLQDLVKRFRTLKDRLKRFGCSGGKFSLSQQELKDLNLLAQRLRQLGL